ncbi:urease accessory protein UreF [Salinihabitans flavidus]|uniref:urease accessory protein UreF n=1 Tax=Salinihabitans flavidus TaxID=569882 RepID=UPI00158789E7|nr:urease accessory UreF family protein [Salinihabitans flavidus]
MTPAHLTLVQWLSPAFPTGAFAYSHGLEQEIASGTVHDRASLEAWLGNILRFGAGWQDAVLLCLALRAGADTRALDAHARALQPSAERLGETLDQGRAMARCVSAVGGPPVEAGPLPLVLGRAAAGLNLRRAEVAALYLQGFVTNLAVIAVRHVPLGQSEGQRVISALQPLIVELAGAAADAGPDDLANAALSADLAAMRHETMDVRIFRT